MVNIMKEETKMLVFAWVAVIAMIIICGIAESNVQGM